ncbi:hypothetical protein Poli38472_013041 [Pythium oligandrum]|uniref:Uncharacterized protein n=1 Tax=Pythium oligandrum TaxID=41045 RepID=A0A8K1CIX8_PYTOL|nr:hypothetical protein Poli38472_013041 [Pythium oligandrum]|eukprot:TMW64419.1 hypothetical protein Poli38472_013041 [Pythium oligandrum]
MSATQQEIEQLQEQIHKGAEETKSYLAALKDKLAEYDSHYKVSETATGYLQAGIDKTHAAVDELKATGGRISQSSKDTSASVLAASQASIAKVRAALDDLKARAVDYDQRVKTSVVTTVGSAKGTVSSSIESIVTATRNGATSGIDLISNTVLSVQNAIASRAAAAGHGAFVKAGDAVKLAEGVDAKLGVSSAVSGAVAAVTERVVGLDSKLGVSETAANIDAKVSGGIGASIVSKGVELVQQSVEYVSTTIQQAKQASDESANEGKIVEQEATKTA